MTTELIDVDPEDANAADDLREAAQHLDALPGALRGIADALREEPEQALQGSAGCCKDLAHAHAHGREMGWFDGLRYAADLLRGTTL